MMYISGFKESMLNDAGSLAAAPIFGRADETRETRAEQFYY